MHLFKLFSFILLLAFLNSCKEKESTKPIRKDIQEMVFASGQIEWDKAYNLTAQTDGVLQRFNLEIGNTVTQGMQVGVIDNPNNIINTQTAQEQLQIANQNVSSNAPALLQLKENIESAELKYQQEKLIAERYKRLWNTETVSKIDYETKQLNAKTAYNNLQSLEKQYQLLQQQAKQQQISSTGAVKNNRALQRYNKLIATENGTVIKKLKNKGDYVRKGEVVATIANPNYLEIVLNIDENSIGKVQIGQKVFVSLNTNKQQILEGKISEILSAFDEQSQSFICKVILNNGLMQSIYGTQLEANILVAQKNNALLIPKKYMAYGNKVSVKGKDSMVKITTGIISTDMVEVLSGINENDVLLPLKP